MNIYKYNEIELRPEYQQPIHDATLNHMRASQEPSFVSASVGAGKTINIAFIARHVVDAGGRVLVLARQGELIAQNTRMARLCGLKCSIYSASLGSTSTFYPAVFGTEGTVVRSLNSHFKDKPFNVILIDESHQLPWEDLIPAKNNNPTLAQIVEYVKTDKFAESEPNQYAQIIAHFLKLNPKTRIIGYTGSPYRGVKDIIGGFWKSKLYDVQTMYLVGLGYLVPPVFGFGDDEHKYDLSQWNPDKNENSASDFSAKELQAMSRHITKDKSLTGVIMEEVVNICESRSGGAMITCAGVKHCEQVSEFLPRGSWAIITGTTGAKKRQQILNECRSGEIKYILQIGCLTTGVNVPPWSTSVILRRIGSLTLLTQLIGRILRILEPEDEKNGFTKTDGLVLDYTDTFTSFGDIYGNPMLDSALAQKGTWEGKSQDCPTCNTKNSQYAVRCVGHADNLDGRCEYFFQFSMCFSCDTQNAPSARNCRNCNAILIDPTKALKNKAYSDADYKEVVSMLWSKTKAGDGVCVTYPLNSIYTENGIEKQEVAKEYYKPFSKERHEQGRWTNFLNAHINCYRFKSNARAMRSIDQVIQSKAIFDKPTHITHRINDKGFSIVSRRKFLSGREAK